ncbi:MAG: sodium ion-translocating decarboxylase subunit beta [Chloroflexi bacterium]|nr:sodium ion-translocating decarboxylase subunit beta [Chloroflexota bacterium]
MSELIEFLKASGIVNIDWRNGVMLIVGVLFVYAAIRRGWEPYQLLPIGIGILIANMNLFDIVEVGLASADSRSGAFEFLYDYGLNLANILPPLIFLGLGAMTDFGPLIANPKLLLLGVTAAVGAFIAFWGALAVNFFTSPDTFSLNAAASIGIIGAADGPTTIFTTARLAPELLGITAVIAYILIAAAPLVQPPIMRLLTTRKERAIVMTVPREVSKTEKLLFPALAMVLIVLFVPEAAALVAMFMMGNLFRESGVVPRITQAATNEVFNIATIFLMLAIGTRLSADLIFSWDTLIVFGIGLFAFVCATVSGIVVAKGMNLVFKDKINPLIGAAGVSAAPNAARVAHHVGQQANPNNFLLSHAMGPNVAGIIGSLVVAGVFLSRL